MEKISALMTKLFYLIHAALLRCQTHLTAQWANATRWSAIYEMMSRYSELKDYLSNIEYAEVTELLFTDHKNEEVDALRKCLQDLNSISGELQADSTTLADGRVLLQGVWGGYL